MVSPPAFGSRDGLVRAIVDRHQVTGLLETRLDRPDRLVPMLLATTTLLADRAHRRGGHDAFVADLVSMATGMLLAD